MKAGKKNVKLASMIDESSANVVQADNVSYHAVIINLLPIFSTLLAILPGILNRNPSVEIIKVGILTLILTATASFFIRMNAENILNKKYAKSIITISYLVSIGLLMLKHSEVMSFWMIGGLVVSMLIDTKLGLLLHFNLAFILGISLSLRPEVVIYLLIIGVLMSLLSTNLKQKSTMIYAAIILLSTNITLAFLINNFIFDTSSNYNYLSSFFSIFAVLVAAFLFCLTYDRFTLKMISTEIADAGEKVTSPDKANAGEKVISSDKSKVGGKVISSDKSKAMEESLFDEISPLIVKINSIEEEKPSEDINLNEPDLSLQNHMGSRTSYEVLNEEGNTLLIKLKDFSEKLYEHALLIGDISFRAAKLVGADKNLARAGGLYHEIGKINGKEYIDEGIRIAEEYAFPKELTQILKQHNIKYDKPTSVEAAIVMLSDNVVSTIEYIEKTGDLKLTANKIIDNIFQLRMDKGTFDNSGLSVRDFKQLKEFYQEEFNSKAR